MKRFSRPLIGWAMYDFANSSYATSIVTAIFSVYFVKTLVPEGGVTFLGLSIPAASVWSYLVATVMLFVLFMAPTWGEAADRRSAKRSYLIFWTLAGSLATMMLFRAKPGHFTFAVRWAFVSFLSYEMALVFYNAFLNEISSEKERGWVSGFGFSLGYLGGGLCLALNMAMISSPKTFGLSTSDPTFPVRFCFLVVGVWWLVFSIPTLLWVKDKKIPHKSPKPRSSFFQIFQTLKRVNRVKNLRTFLLAYIIYNDGIQTLIIMASIFGAQVLGMSIKQLGLCILLIQFVAFFGALYFGRLADRIGHKQVVLITLATYSLVTLWALFMTSQTEFWMMGVIVGLILGGSQAASRSLFSQMVPKGQEGELFAIYSVVGKAAAVIGPLVFGLATQMIGLRAGVGVLTLFFIIGGGLLLLVKESGPNPKENL